jgi:hypothetical protein
MKLPNIGLNAVAGRPNNEWGFEPSRLEDMRKGCYDVDARVDDMNACGVLASCVSPRFQRSRVRCSPTDGSNAMSAAMT